MNHEELSIRMRGIIERRKEHIAEISEDEIGFISTTYPSSQFGSPIEQILFVGLSMNMAEWQQSGSKHGGEFRSLIPNVGIIERCEGFVLKEPVMQMDILCRQVPISGYRADFVIQRTIKEYRSDVYYSPQVILECDGHEFHEKTKEQAGKDKKRDRVFQAAGFRVLRFTGTEIWNNVNGCVEEIDEFLDDSISKQILSNRKKHA